MVPRARRRSCRVSQVRSPFRARASAPLALRENTPLRKAPSSACPPSRAVLLLRTALLSRSRAPRVVTRAAQATRSALCVSLENTPSRSSRLSALVLNTGTSWPSRARQVRRSARSGGTRLARARRAVPTRTLDFSSPTRPQRSKRRVLLDLTRQRPRALANCARPARTTKNQAKLRARRVLPALLWLRGIRLRQDASVLRGDC